jgi:hypothetical protein
MYPTGNLTPGLSISQMDLQGPSGHALRNKNLKPDSNCRIGDGHYPREYPRSTANYLLYAAVFVSALGFSLVKLNFLFEGIEGFLQQPADKNLFVPVSQQGVIRIVRI